MLKFVWCRMGAVIAQTSTAQVFFMYSANSATASATSVPERASRPFY